MYKVYSDSFLLYDDNLSTLQIFEPRIDLELNKTGSFEFTIYPNHMYYDMIHKMKSIITVYQDDFLLFRGRVLDDDFGFYNEKQVICEGHLAFLLDSIQRSYLFEGYLRDVVTSVIAVHNSQVEASHQFTVGTVDGGDAYVSISSTEHANTWDVVNKEFIEGYGWYICTRYENGVHYIDFLDAFPERSTQTVEFAKNLLDMKRKRSGADIKTALIPLGAKLKDAEGNDTEERLTVETVNDGLDYVQDEDAVEQYGWICETVIFDEITDASELLSIGKAHLSGLVNALDVLELTAADLASIDSTMEAFKIGMNVRVTSNPHGINQDFLVNKLSVNLRDPASNVLTLGGKIEPFTAKVMSISVHDGKDGEDAIVYNIEIISSNGNFFKNGVISTTLYCFVFQNDENITGSINAARFHWQKLNNDGTHDEAWEASHAGGTKEIAISSNDVQGRATFTCSVDGISN